MSAIAKLVKNSEGETPPTPRAERTAIWSPLPQSSAAICTPSFNKHSECPEEGWPAGLGRSLFTVSAIAKLVKNSGGETPPTPRAERTAIWSPLPQSSAAICTPSFNEHRECPEEGWPAGPGRSLFTVSAIAKLVKNIGGESAALPGAVRTAMLPARHLVHAGGLLPISTGFQSRAKAKRRGRSLFTVSAIAKLVKNSEGETPPTPRAERTAIWSPLPQSSAAFCTPSFNEHRECPEEGWPAGPGRSLCPVSAIAKLVKNSEGETPPAPRAVRTAMLPARL